MQRDRVAIILSRKERELLILIYLRKAVAAAAATRAVRAAFAAGYKPAIATSLGAKEAMVDGARVEVGAGTTQRELPLAIRIKLLKKQLHPSLCVERS